MKAHLKWIGGMKLEASTDGNAVLMDSKAPLGQGKGMTPKELVVAGLMGCTAMDVVALLKKHKQTYDSLEVDAEVSTTSGVHPAVFTEAVLTFNLQGSVEPKILMEAVQLSQTQYCGVSAMLSKAFPIRYRVVLNATQIGEGQAHF